MGSKVNTSLRLRRDYSQRETPREIPNLIDIQWKSFEEFIQTLQTPEDRTDKGMQAVFKSVFPIKDYNDTASLEFVGYDLGEPKYDTRECQERGMTWAAPLKVTIQLVLWDNSEDGDRQIRDIKEQEVYFGEIPLMTKHGTFMINGTERVVVSQLHRSPGVFFEHDKGKSHSSGKLLYSARIIPYRGSWLDFEFDIKDVLHVRIDRRRKQPASIILRALGMSSEEIIHRFYKTDSIKIGKKDEIIKKFVAEQLESQKAFKEIKSGSKVLAKAGQKYNRAVIRRLNEAGTKEIQVAPEEVEGFYAAYTIIHATADVVHPGTKRTLIKEGTIVTGMEAIKKALPESLSQCDEEEVREVLTNIQVVIQGGEQFEPDVKTAKGKLKSTGTMGQFAELGITEFDILYTKDNHIGDSLIKTIHADGLEPEREDIFSHLFELPQKNALVEIYKRLRPGDPPRVETAQTTFDNLFFNPERYDLSAVGRLKVDYKLHRGEAQFKKRKIGTKKDAQSGSEFTEGGTLTAEDICQSVGYLLALRTASDPINFVVDDIDHLGNRRVRSVGELVENQYRLGLVRMERASKERMSIQDIETVMPQDLINYKPVSAVLKEFFGSSQLSQFMDQTNPLSEITHKRRLSALGPGGLTRERAGFEVRDVHPTHYGRVCPIETPEGPNIGLISSMATYARINQYGFVETPYRTVTNGKVSNDSVFLSAMEEAKEIIAQASAPLNEDGSFKDALVTARKHNEFLAVPKEEITLMDVSPSQLVSVAASLIPFLENDDANRALMGSNMQRQAVPLLKTSAPLVGTGVEKVVAGDSGATVVALRDSKIQAVDGNRIVLKASKSKVTEDPLDTGVDIYNLIKYQRSNQNTCINQRPIVRVGDKVKAGDVIADGQSTDMGELALGKNVLVAFMPWGGYNFEDSILISERLVKEDTFTSIHIEEFAAVARDTKLGSEEITRDIPNVGEEALKNLDESGIIRIGAEVKPDDILVGKITPKSETQLSPEEKLLRAIFGEKAGEVRDTSLRLPPGVEGTVISAHVCSRKGTTKDDRMLEIEKSDIARLEQDQRDEIRILRSSALAQLAELVEGKTTTSRLVDEGRKQLIAKGAEITRDLLESIPFEYLRDIQVGDESLESDLNKIVVGTGQLINNKRSAISEKIKRLKKGDDLPPGVIKMVKVFVAVKRRLSVGDKFAGRHGNKGVLSRILPEEDMPYLPDGTPVDMVLNPLGVPSRMNVGQILETHLGWACYGVGRKLRNLLEKVCDPRISIEDGVTSDPNILKDVSGEVRYVLENALPDGRDKFLEKLNEKEILEVAQKDLTGVHIATPVFEGAKETDIRNMLELADLDSLARTQLFDGKTGEPFSEEVTVGVMYMLKLHHLVDDKIHARSTGPYSLVTQQPLGGKAQFGGQRLGEMEVWALEAYGAAYALQEFLTVKSDDTAGRTRMYEAIVKGEHVLEPGLPESFNVMCKELMSLGLDLELIEGDSSADGALLVEESKELDSSVATAAKVDAPADSTTAEKSEANSS